MTSAGFTISGDDHPISPVMLGDAQLASDMADDMLSKFPFKKKKKMYLFFKITWPFSERGIFVIGFSYPVVPKGKARIRVQISAAHTTEDIDRTVEAFIEVGRARNVIPWLIKKSENTKISNHLNVELKYNVAQLEQVLLISQ